jgi:hypothetical protein
VLDLAQRLAIANPEFDALAQHDHRHGVDENIDPLASPAIVLIDEFGPAPPSCVATARLGRSHARFFRHTVYCYHS